MNIGLIKNISFILVISCMTGCKMVLKKQVSSQSCATVSADSYAEMRMTEEVKKSVEHRLRAIDVFVYPPPKDCAYRVREEIYGCLSPKTNFLQAYYSGEIEEKNRRTFLHHLIGQGVLNLTNEFLDSSIEEKQYISIRGRINNQEINIRNHFTNSNVALLKVYDAFLCFGQQIVQQIPHNYGSGASETIVEGDLQPARSVTIDEILSHPDQFHGLRVSAIGYYHRNFEHSSLSVTQEEKDVLQSIWVGAYSVFADLPAQRYNEGLCKITGIFLKGPTGHRGLWPGKIVRITEWREL